MAISHTMVGRISVSLAVLVGLVGVLWGLGTFAAFTATTANAGNGFAAGTVVLTDDDGGSSLFTVSGLKPGDSSQQCITAQYGGSLTGGVRVYLATVSGGLAPYLNVTLDEGTGGTGASCTGFAPDVTSFTSASLSSAATAYSSYATGTGSWGVTAAGQTRRYRITVTFDAATPNGSQTSSATADFRWEMRDLSDATGERARDAVLADSPTAYYRLGDSGATAVDAVSGANGTYQGSAFTHPFGIVGSPDWAASFNGSNQYVQLPSNSYNLTAGMTLEVWAKFTTTSDWQRLIELSNGQNLDNVFIARSYNSNHLTFRIHHGGSSQDIVAPNVIDGLWHHVVATQTAGGVATLYVDGVSKATATLWMPTAGSRSVNYIAKSAFTDPLFAGSIDDVAIYTAPLSAARVLAHYRAGR